jgi:FMN phosphatase YigB (HAD superfamily)
MKQGARRFSLLIFDLDNTLYDWYSAFLPAFYEMATVAANALECDRELLLDQLQQVHIKHRDVEHPFSLLETDIVKRMLEENNTDIVMNIVDPAFHAFNRKRKENLRLYPGVLETMNTLRDSDIRLIAYTDSKYYAAWGRICRLGLEDIFETVYCREKGLSHGSKRLNASGSNPPPGRVVELPSHEAKPNPRILSDIVEAQEVPMSCAAYIGDSLTKDVLMAKRAQCFAVWAKYGAHTDRAMYDRLARISHWNPKDIERERNYAEEAKSIKPDFICEHSITEILEAV